MQKAQHCKYRFFLTFLVCVMGSQVGVFAQRITLKIQPEDTDTIFLQENAVYETEFLDTFSLYNQLADLRLQLNGQGYLEASTDSLIWQDSTATAHFHLGKQYEWAFLKNGNVEIRFWSKRVFERNYIKIRFLLISNCARCRNAF